MNDYSELNKNLLNINNNLELLNNRVKILEDKIDNLDNKINSEILQECKKMGSHIDFVENVYDNVKHPLGYITNKIKYLTSTNNTENYALPDKK